ncbi:Crp/Fnr family transcriptional regulator [Elizabethkingia anophelis]|uniref:cAMP-binding protein-catabolite gene activator and regulatory subunit of cAMP-dependent protein kinase n=1 Tax=Elizabethkingia anophelis NUHP1 TaxID=1338011 RepID=A0A077EGU0_9FLAO|nr:Crp/Fnr family transcriptional regulator [Elizabethkingia anophelis]AIL44740.1 cAMP-binding protein - catabolite gene activator and regulatory subunit of cAMP-dependent protein kinase [Elizabethkingia anophelis NUHP1]MBE9393189.1 Crp/Fnr family transcriptional regulator [Elizabethkingia anophelis]MBE9406211.1 Crp/Fnr family transcriptional regulator [Elizabethkingia anophelis]MDV3928693.1 Crp/Fnr family transcriptional regulator [Elizabethkingia anophelis]MDV4026718.1 Crp/Fnr family transcr
MKEILNDYETYGPLFLVDREHYEEFCSYLKKMTLRKSEYFLKEGEQCEYLGFLKEGLMRTFYINENGEDINFNFHFNHHFFTDYESILQNVKSKMNIKALKDSEIMLLHKDDLQKLYQKEAYWQEFGRKMTEVIYLSAQKRIEELLYYVPERRYYNLLSENPQVFQLIPLKHIASYLGIKPQSLSRIRNRTVKH